MTIAEQLADIRRDVLSLAEKLNGVVAAAQGAADPIPQMEPLTVEQFAVAVKRGKDWVYDQIRLYKASNGKRGVRVLRGGRPYQIPPSEVMRYFAPGDN